MHNVIRSLVIATLALSPQLSALRSHAQGIVLSVNSQGGTAAQWVIPRHHKGTQYPSGQLVGRGPQTVYTGTADTANLAFPAVVVTEDAGAANISQWQGGTSGPGYAAAILCPEVRNLTIRGHDPTGTDYVANGDVATNPDLNGGMPYKYYLLHVRANGATVDNVKLFYCPGIAFSFGRDLNPSNGQVLAFDSEKNYADKIRISRCFAGLDVTSVDLVIHDIEVTKWRDFAIRMFSATQASDLHCYGGSGYGIWCTSTANQIDRAYSENVHTGFRVQGNANVLRNLRSHTCSIRNILLEGSYNIVDGFVLSGTGGGFFNPNPLCIEIWGEECNVKNGRCDLRSGDTGIKIDNGTRHTIEDVYFNSFNVFNTTCIDVNHTLVASKVDFLMVGGGIGLDLNDGGVSRLGNDNIITIRAHHTGGNTEIIDLPDTWSKTNQIEVGGLRVKGTITDATIGSPTTITSPSHGLTTGDRVAIGAMVGTNNCNSSAGAYHTVTVVNGNQFTIGNHTGTYTAGTGFWGEWKTR